MRPRSLLCFLLGFCLAVYPVTAAPDVPPDVTASLRACFTPGQPCRDLIITNIDLATYSLHVQAYLITEPLITAAIIRAKQRGVTVIVILDKSFRHLSPLAYRLLPAAGVDLLIDSQHAIAHNKVVIIDASHVITGSYNFTVSAQQRNAENLLLVHSPELAALYEQNFQRHLLHSLPPSQPLPRFPSQH